MRALVTARAILLGLVLLLAGLLPTTASAQTTPTPSRTPSATATTISTATAIPTASPVATGTSVPNPQATSVPVASDTPLPSPTAPPTAAPPGALSAAISIDPPAPVSGQPATVTLVLTAVGGTPPPLQNSYPIVATNLATGETISTTALEVQPGVYAGPIGFPDAGPWMLSSPSLPGASGNALTVTVQPGGPPPGALAPIVGSLSLDPASPFVGDPATLTLTLSSASGAPPAPLAPTYGIVGVNQSTNETVSVTAQPVQPGVYTAVISFPSAGLWQLSSPDLPASAQNSLAVSVQAQAAPAPPTPAPPPPAPAPAPAPEPVAPPAPAPQAGPPPEAFSGPCFFVLGFAELHDLIPDIVGDCLDNEYHGANGDGLQDTTDGLLAWRKADNWTAFTDGANTWINGPFGLETRPNTVRFTWEGDAGSFPNIPD